jgi:glycerophosphoryl diester phosphodiesterase
MARIFSHRGLHDRVRENTVEAFAEAVAVGADGIELDVRRCGDGALVVHHNPHLDDGRLIRDVACRDLPPYVPTLAIALAACGDLVVNVEIKNDPHEPDFDPSGSLVTDVYRIISEAGQRDRVIISSFDLVTCTQVVAMTSPLPVGWLLDVGADVDECARRAAGEGFAAIHPFCLDLNPRNIAGAQELGLAVNTWTVNNEVDIRRLLAAGVDCLITDNPALAQKCRADAD